MARQAGYPSAQFDLARDLERSVVESNRGVAAAAFNAMEM